MIDDDDDYEYDNNDKDNKDDDDEDDIEQMQLDPSTDFYDDDDEEDDDDDEEEYSYDENPKEKYNNNEEVATPKALDLTLETTTTTSKRNNNERRHVPEQNDEEEIDMGYDEDDERIAAERAPHNNNNNKPDDGYMNEEGSGGGGVSIGGHGKFNNYKDEKRFRPTNYLTTKYTNSNSNNNNNNNNNNNKKGRNMFKERGGDGIGQQKNQEFGIREGSGNFANDDENDNEDDIEDDDDDDDDGVDDDKDSTNGGGFFSSNRKTNNRYFRKNTNDAIKIISTPLGKVGIVYQQTPTDDEINYNNNKKSDSSGDNNSNTNNNNKKSTVLTDFDALSPDPDSSRLASSSHPKITPVLTPDGKVALLYRGDSENTKYEPIRNLTHKLINNNNHNHNNKDDIIDNKDSITSATNKQHQQQHKATFAKDSDEQIDFNESTDFDDDDDDDGDSVSKSRGLDDKNHHGDFDKEASYTPVFVPPTSGSFIIRPTDSVLPMINRPLSEVLGIKKNQFKQFRVKDISTMTSSSSTDQAIPRSLSGTVNNEQSSSSSSSGSGSSTTLHFLTKVNLAEYPTSMKGQNRDFDFSQDNTMLDERNRHRSEQHLTNDKSNNNDGSNNDGSNTNVVVNSESTFANEEMLSKTEVVDLAIIPHLDNEYGRYDVRRHHRNRQIHRHKQKDEDLSGIHCVMQIMMGIAAISTVFGMLGTFFKQRILDQLRLMHW